MSEADKMFKELGYENNKTEQAHTYYIGQEKIIFWLWAKNIQMHKENNLLNIQELQAINKKCEELWGLDE